MPATPVPAAYSLDVSRNRFGVPWSEVGVVLVLSALFLVANLVTASRSPTVWHDETVFIDPAVSLYLGQGFRSAGWYAQTKDEVFAGCPPLYQVMLAHWLKLTGFSLTGTRSMNFALMLGAALLLWLASIRLRLVARTWGRLAMFTLLLSGYGITFIYRSGRIDPLHIFLTGAFVYVCSLSTTWLRAVLLTFLGIATVLSGYQFVAYAAIMVTLAWVFVGRCFWPNVASYALGGAMGTALLYGYLLVVGAAGKLAKTTGRFLLEMSWPDGFMDYSFMLLLVAALVLVLHQVVAGRFRWKSTLTFGLVAAIAAPLGLTLLGRYPIYYSWMAWLPLTVGVCAAASEAGALPGRLAQVAVTAVVLATGAIGLPARVALTVSQWQERDYRQVERLADRTVTAADWVYADFPGYYAVKSRAGLTILQPYREVITDDEKRRVTRLFIRPENFADVSQFLGGRWEDTGEAVVPKSAEPTLGAAKYDLRVFRRPGR